MSDFPINRPIDATRHLRGPQGDTPAAPPPGTEDPGLVLGHFVREIGRLLGTSAEGKVPERHAPAVQALRAMLAERQVPIFATLPPPPGGGPLSGEGGGGVRAVDTARPPGPFARANDHLLGRFMPPLPGERPDAAFARLIDGFQPPVPQGAIGEAEAREIRAVMQDLARVRSDNGHLPLTEREVADITREAMQKVLGLEGTGGARGGGTIEPPRPPGPFVRANDVLLGRFMPPLPGERPDAAFARLIDGFQPPVPPGAIGETEAREIRAIMLELARVRSDNGHLPLGERDVADITREAMRKVLGLEATEPLLTGGDTSAGRGEVAPPPGTTFA
jgi:hypothetical protein